jgi:hypothetical protein
MFFDHINIKKSSITVKDIFSSSLIRLDSFGLLFLLINGVFFIWWISFFNTFEYSISNTANLLLFNSGVSQVSKVETLYDLGNFYGYNMVFEIIKRYFENIWYILGGFITIIIYYLYVIPNEKTNTSHFIMLPVFFGFSLILTGILFFMDIGVNIWRIIIYPTLISIFIFAYMPDCLDYIFKQNPNSLVKKIISIIICFFVVFTLINGIFISYPSTYLHMNNYQVTIYDLTGMNFLFSKGNGDYTKVTVAMSPGRFGRLLLSYDQFEKNKLDDFRYLTTPFHFNYNKTPSLGSTYNSYTYLDLHEKDKHLYTSVHPEVAESTYLTTDFNRLNMDSTINSIYNNGQFELKLITPLK